MTRSTIYGLLAVLMAGFVASEVALAQGHCWGPDINRSMTVPMAEQVIVNAVSTELPDGVVMVFSTLDPPITIVWVLDPVAEQVAIRGGEGPGVTVPSTPPVIGNMLSATIGRSGPSSSSPRWKESSPSSPHRQFD